MSALFALAVGIAGSFPQVTTFPVGSFAFAAEDDSARATDILEGAFRARSESTRAQLNPGNAFRLSPTTKVKVLALAPDKVPFEEDLHWELLKASFRQVEIWEGNLKGTKLWIHTSSLRPKRLSVTLPGDRLKWNVGSWAAFELLHLTDFQQAQYKGDSELASTWLRSGRVKAVPVGSVGNVVGLQGPNVHVRFISGPLKGMLMYTRGGDPQRQLGAFPVIKEGP